MNETKTAIVLVAFGSKVAGTNIAYRLLEEKINEKFSNIRIYHALTSEKIRSILNEKGQNVLSPKEVLTQLHKWNYTKVIVQSLHLVPGAEYSGLKEEIELFAQHTVGLKVIVSQPLLLYHKDFLQVSRALICNLPKERNKNELVLFMGHGTAHQANVYYPALNYYLQLIDNKVYLATIEGFPELKDVLNELMNSRERKVWVVPFLAVAGKHVHEDMNGSGETSWRTVLERNGFSVSPVPEGLTDNKYIVDIWLKHIEELLKDKKD